MSFIKSFIQFYRKMNGRCTISYTILCGRVLTFDLGFKYKFKKIHIKLYTFQAIKSAKMTFYQYFYPGRNCPFLAHLVMFILPFLSNFQPITIQLLKQVNKQERNVTKQIFIILNIVFLLIYNLNRLSYQILSTKTQNLIGDEDRFTSTRVI